MAPIRVWGRDVVAWTGGRHLVPRPRVGRFRFREGVTTPQTTWTDRALAALRLERRPLHRPPAGWRVTVASLASLAGSLVVDEFVVAAGTRLFPSTEGYVHFRFSDYGRLTIIGVVVACLAWPVTARISSAPRWLFLRMAVLVTLVLWLPDLWILLRGQSPRAVAVLIIMHLAIALVTYNLVVRLAPVRAPVSEGDSVRDASSPAERHDEASPTDRGSSPRWARRAGIAMADLVVVELALGLGALVVVPYARGTTLVPSQGFLVYAIHSALGGMLGLGAVALFLFARRAQRLARLGSVIGLVGVVSAAGGGVASMGHATRLFGVGLMLVGTVVAGLGYILMIVETTSRIPRTIPEPSDGLIAVSTEAEQEESE